jgi:hypothetical protein
MDRRQRRKKLARKPKLRQRRRPKRKLKRYFSQVLSHTFLSRELKFIHGT